MFFRAYQKRQEKGKQDSLALKRFEVDVSIYSVENVTVQQCFLAFYALTAKSVMSATRLGERLNEV